jgi:hypothetical protein
MGLRTHAREVAAAAVRMRPAPGSRYIALRVSVSLFVPLLLLWATGHLAWVPYAAFGAFTSLYGRQQRHAARAGMQIQAGITLAACVVIGMAVATAHAPQLIVLGGALVSVWAAWLSDRYAWHPPGSLFPVFGFAACATIPGATARDVWIAALVSTGSAAFALLVGSVGRFRREWSGPFVIRRTPRPLEWAAERRHLARYLLAPLIAGELGDLTHWGHVYWAMVAAVVPMAAPTVHGRLARGVQRMVGTFAGVGVAYLVLTVSMPVIWLIVVAAVLPGVRRVARRS